jgi:aminoglycoside phosphotransferase (APT) family kinase protein
LYLNWALGLRALGCQVIWLERVVPSHPAHEVKARIAALKSHLERYAPVLIHGEYCQSHILFRNEVSYPADWESATSAAGEVDLASLTEGWPAEIVRQCELEYQRVRWPEGLLGVYLHFRWLGDHQGSAAAEYHLWRFEELRSAGARLGVM